MPKKTKKQKIIAAYRNRLQQLQTSQTTGENNFINKSIIKQEKKLTPIIDDKPVSSSATEVDKVTTQYFFSDLKKSLLIIVFIIALEFILYFVTINNYSVGLIKF